VEYTFVDLFAGIGGIRLGFEAAAKKCGTKARCVFTSEWDSYAQKTYLENFPGEAIAGDITQIDPEKIPDHDVLLAGFPCQPFSIAGVSKKNSLGREHGFKDPTQGTLFFNLKQIIASKRPRAFLLENVKHLQRHDKGRTIKVIKDVLEEELGYDLHVHVLDGARFVPQHRERIFLVGFREPRDFNFPMLPARGPRLRRILEKKVPDRYTLSDHLWDYLQRYAEKHRARGNGFGFGKVGPDDVARTLSARYYKDGSEILVHQPRRNPRRLTPRECARLMGFKDTFQIPVSDTRAYKQFGNSVVVPLITAVACELVKALKRPALKERKLKVPEQVDLPLSA
jgi:DNA (cytosine-5)-methyltransferase 1